MATTETPTLTAIEDRLRDDQSGALRDEILGELQQQARRVKQRIDSGVTAQEFGTLDSCAKSAGSSGAGHVSGLAARPSRLNP